MKIDIVNMDDWVAIYFDGELVEEGHSISFDRFLYLQGIKHTTHSIEVPSEDSEDDDVDYVPRSMEDIEAHKAKHPDWFETYEEGTRVLSIHEG